MRRHAKASSAGSKPRKPSGHGRSPSSGRLRLTILLATVAAFLLVPVAQALANPTATVSIEGIEGGSGTVKGKAVFGGIPTPINCSGPPTSGTCSAEMAEIEEGFYFIELPAIPDPGSELVAWEVEGELEFENCSNPAFKKCNVASFGGNVEVTAYFGPEVTKFPLTVTKSGEGSGQVTSSPAGISCGFKCSAEFEEGTEVTLTASPEFGAEFAGWSGAGCSGTGTCEVTMSEAKSVNAQFDLEPIGPTNRRTLTVTKSAGGSGGVGTVKSKPKGINCATACNKAVGSFYEDGPTPSNVVLTAKPATGSTFTEWTGACSGSELTCTVAMSEDKEVGAVFGGTSKAILNPQALTVTKDESSGFGTVKGKPGLACEAECTETTVLYQGPEKPKTVELSATAAFGSEFVEWGGACSGSEPTCSVTMSEAKEVTATFTAKPTVGLTVSKNTEEGNYSSGTGTVTSKQKGIKCATACTTQTMSVPTAEAILLKAKAATGMTFSGWGGVPCTSETVTTTEGTCTVSLAEAGTVVAEFSGAPKAILNPQALNLEKAGSGFGTVKGTGLTCEALCTSATSLYQGPEKPKVVVLLATPALGSKAVVWSGCDAEPEGNCEVTMTEAKNVTATFDELE